MSHMMSHCFSGLFQLFLLNFYIQFAAFSFVRVDVKIFLFIRSVNILKDREAAGIKVKSSDMNSAGTNGSSLIFFIFRLLSKQF